MEAPWVSKTHQSLVGLSGQESESNWLITKNIKKRNENVLSTEQVIMNLNNRQEKYSKKSANKQEHTDDSAMQTLFQNLTFWD